MGYSNYIRLNKLLEQQILYFFMILFSADDYGYSQKGSDKILLCNEKEPIIRNTSVLSNFASSNALFNLKLSKISKGIHLNLVEGRSIGKHQTLTNEVGFFMNKATLIKNILTKKLNLNEIYSEANLQIERILDFGIELSYADSHQNTHFLPQIMNQFEKAIRKHKITKVRGQEPIYSWFDKSINLKAIAHTSLGYFWDKIYTKNLTTSNKIILKAPGMGLSVSNMDEALLLWNRAFKKYNKNILYEVPCHLDYSELEFQLYSSAEFYNLLLKYNIQPISYAELL